MKRKILAAVLAMSMITCSMPMTVSAEGEEAGGSAQQVEETVQELETEDQATQEPETQELATPALSENIRW